MDTAPTTSKGLGVTKLTRKFCKEIVVANKRAPAYINFGSEISLMTETSTYHFDANVSPPGFRRDSIRRCNHFAAAIISALNIPGAELFQHMRVRAQIFFQSLKQPDDDVARGRRSVNFSKSSYGGEGGEPGIFQVQESL